MPLSDNVIVTHLHLGKFVNKFEQQYATVCALTGLSSRWLYSLIFVTDTAGFFLTSVCPSVRKITQKDTKDFDAIFYRGGARPKEQCIRFWWRSGSGSESRNFLYSRKWRRFVFYQMPPLLIIIIIILVSYHEWRQTTHVTAHSRVYSSKSKGDTCACT